MAIKCSEISGFLIECKEISKHEICTPNYELGFNEAITHQGSVKIGLSREKLAETICDSRYGDGSFMRWKQITSSHAESLIYISYEDADAIISREAELFEVVKDKT